MCVCRVCLQIVLTHFFRSSEFKLATCSGRIQSVGPKQEHGFSFLAGRAFGAREDGGKGVGEEAESNVALKGKFKGTDVCPENGKITVGMSKEIS